MERQPIRTPFRSLPAIRWMGRLVIFLSLALILSGCAGRTVEPISLEPSIEGQLEPVHPDESVDQTFSARFSMQNALAGLKRVRETATKPSGEAGMAFSNALGAMEGTLRKQEYEVRKLEFELAKVQFRDGQISKGQLDQKESAYRTAVEDFRTFWGGFGIGD